MTRRRYAAEFKKEAAILQLNEYYPGHHYFSVEFL